VVPAWQLAEGPGEIRAANMVMLGAFIHTSGLVKRKTFIGLLQENFPRGKRKLLDLNQQALYAGFNIFNNNQEKTTGVRRNRCSGYVAIKCSRARCTMYMA